MNLTRREFVKDSLVTLGFLALPGGLWAAPAGWKPKGRPNLVVGILSDTHLQSGWDGVKPHDGFPLTYVTNAMKLFRDRNIDAFMHLGDAAHRGKNVEIQYHRDIFDKFFPHGKAKDGHKVEKLLVVGNHELYGNVAGGGGAWAPNIWKDPVERAKHVLCGDLPKHWERVWGEKYEEVWHKEVKGYHFFGRHWHKDEYKHAGEKPFADYIRSKADQFSLRGTKPFFILSHRRHHAAFCQALKDFPNAIALFGHWHWSNADWKTIFFDADTFGGRFPNIQVGACRMDGGNAVTPSSEVKLPEDSSSWKGDNLPSRQAMIINIYDDMVVFERHEVGKGGKLGPDWVLPLGEFKPHPFSRDELKKVVGEPEFGKKAKLVVAKGTQATKATKGTKKGDSVASVPSLKIKIPMADGNPESRVYAYEIVVVGDDPKAKLFKNAFFEGANAGIGHEPNHGVTEVEIPVSELPPGKKLTIDVSPCSSLGTKGKTIATTWRV